MAPVLKTGGPKGSVGSNPTLSAKSIGDKMAKQCTCGRSITGDCLGWHNLTNEEYERARMEAEIKADAERHNQMNESAPQLLQE